MHRRIARSLSRCTLATLCVTTIGAGLLAQEPTQPADSARLDALLAELARVPDSAWEARIKRARDAATAERAKLDALRAEIRELEQRATTAEGAERAALVEVERLTGLRKAVVAMAGGRPVAEAVASSPAEEDGEEPMPAAKPAPAERPTSAPTAPSAKDEVLYTFDDHLEPIFEEHCTICHDAVDQEGGLDLTSYRGLVQGGGSGKTLVPGEPEASRLYQLVSHQGEPTMPPDEPRIPAPEIDSIRTWIAQGAPENQKRALELQKERAAQRAAMAGSADAGTAALSAVMPERLPPVERRESPRPPAMRAVAASPCAPLLALPGHGQVLLWHAERLEELGVLDFPYGTVDVLRFSADGARLLAAGGRPGRVGGAVLYDVRTGLELGRYGEVSDSVLGAAVSPDGTLIAVGGPQRRVDVFRVDGGERAYRVSHDDWVLACDFSPDGQLLASSDRGGAVIVVQARTGRDVHTISGHAGAVHAVRFAPGSDLLASAGADRSVRAWRMSDGRGVWNKRGHRDEVLCLSWRESGRLLSGGADGRLRAWTPSGGDEGGGLPRLGEWLYGLDSSGSRLFAVDWGGRLCEVDLESRKPGRSATPLGIVE